LSYKLYDNQPRMTVSISPIRETSIAIANSLKDRLEGATVMVLF